MTEAAERVKAFCKRVVDYEKAYQEYWKNQLGAQEDSDEPTSDIIKLIDKIDELIEPSKATLEEVIRKEKLPYCRLLAKARGEVYDLIMESPLSPLQRRILIYRYNRAWTWERIRAMIKFKRVRSVYRVHNQAMERMVPTMQRMYPNWKIGDE